jgi:hypothetical protein
MTDAELKRALKQLGVDRLTVRALPLLPLVQVAWADGLIQPAERGLIREIAQRHGLEGAELVTLDRWLARRPTREEFALAQRALIVLWARDRERGRAPERLDGLVRLCHGVARVAGGLFGVAFTLDRREASVIAEIQRALRAQLPERTAPVSRLAPKAPPAPAELAPVPLPAAPKAKPKLRPPPDRPTILPPDEDLDAATLPLASLRRLLREDDETELDLPVLSSPYDFNYEDDEP